jgi:septum formation protein
MIPLILASTSPYRSALLTRLGLPFETQSPEIDENLIKHKKLPARVVAETLAYDKALDIYQKKGGNVCVIGGDQLVSFEGSLIGKPSSTEQAVNDLLRMSGKLHELITSICIIHPNQTKSHTDITTLYMRSLSEQQIRRYVDLERPLDCAGSYKIEKHGIALFNKIESADHSAIMGLPLIALTNILAELGYEFP